MARSIWKTAIKDRREHPAVTCNINRKGRESEPSLHALPCASLSDHPTASEGFQSPDNIATVAVAGTGGSPSRVSALRVSLPAGPQRPTRMHPNHVPVFSGSPYPSGPPTCPACLRSKSGLLMPKTSSPCHNGKSPNRRLSRAPVGGCGSKRVSLTLDAHRAYSANWPVIADLIQTLTLYASHGAPSSGQLIYSSMPCGEARPCSVPRPDVGPGLHGVP